jgi:hypothetical protein
MFKYLKEYLNKFNDNKFPWFLWSAFTESHEPSANLGRILDDDLSEFLSTSVDFSKTIVLLLSDHGIHVFINKIV